MFCTNCGNELNENSDVCLKCGCLVNKKNTNTQTENEKLSNKSKVAGGLLGLFLGGLGVHNFYLGHKGKGAIQLILSIIAIIFCSVALLIIEPVPCIFTVYPLLIFIGPFLVNI